MFKTLLQGHYVRSPESSKMPLNALNVCRMQTSHMSAVTSGPHMLGYQYGKDKIALQKDQNSGKVWFGFV